MAHIEGGYRKAFRLTVFDCELVVKITFVVNDAGRKRVNLAISPRESPSLDERPYMVQASFEVRDVNHKHQKMCFLGDCRRLVVHSEQREVRVRYEQGDPYHLETEVSIWNKYDAGCAKAWIRDILSAVGETEPAKDAD